MIASLVKHRLERRHLVHYEHEAIRIPKGENNIGAPSRPQKCIVIAKCCTLYAADIIVRTREGLSWGNPLLLKHAAVSISVHELIS